MKFQLFKRVCLRNIKNTAKLIKMKFDMHEIVKIFQFRKSNLKNVIWNNTKLNEQLTF